MGILFIILGVVFLAVLFIRLMTSPSLKYHSPFYRAKAAIVFWIGNIRRLRSFPWVTWAVEDHLLSLADVREADSKCLPGDIGLHRDSGFASNLSIPGAFKHAWVCVEGTSCVEATSDGVVKRDRMTPLLTDYAVILRPVGVEAKQTMECLKRANALVGCEYDANFKFDFESTDRELETNSNLRGGSFHGAFSCTETVAVSWYHCKKALGIFRSKHAGREAVIADDFLKMKFEIVWASESVTLEWAEKMGLHEEGRQKISDFWESV